MTRGLPSAQDAPWWRAVLVNRYAPYAALIVLCALSPALPHKMHPNNTWWAIAGLTLLGVFMVMWAAALHPEIEWIATVGPLLFMLGVQFLRNADGNAASGFSSLIYLPVIWFAFYGKRYQVVLALLGGFAVQILPIVTVGAPQYPAAAWRGTVLFLLVLATLGPIVQVLIQRTEEANAELALRERQFRAAFADAPVGTVLSRIGGPDDRKILNVNAALCTLLGRRPEEMIGREVYDFVHPDDRAALRQRRDSLRAGTHVPPADQRLMHTSGRIIWVSMSFSLIRNEDGTPVQIISQVEDVTARREADLALLEALEAEREAAERARAAAIARRDVVSGISHDLRTPITSAAGFAELLSEGDAGELNDEQKSMLATVRRSLDRIAAIVDDLLALSRTDQEVAPRADIVVLGDVVENVVHSISVQAGERGLELSYVNNLDGVRVHGDASRLDRAIANLLSNAVKFTPPDGTISVRADSDGSQATVVVSDTGVGIPESDVAKIFDKYFRSNSASDDVAGTGLGLAIVHAVAQQHSGHVTVQSEVGKGTTFTLTLPVAA